MSNSNPFPKFIILYRYVGSIIAAPAVGNKNKKTSKLKISRQRKKIDATINNKLLQLTFQQCQPTENDARNRKSPNLITDLTPTAVHGAGCHIE